jgi:hypothetical protein
MARRDKKSNEPVVMKQKVSGYKLRTTNDLLLLSMILDEDVALRERIMRFMEAQLGKKNASLRNNE